MSVQMLLMTNFRVVPSWHGNVHTDDVHDSLSLSRSRLPTTVTATTFPAWIPRISLSLSTSQQLKGKWTNRDQTYYQFLFSKRPTLVQQTYPFDSPLSLTPSFLSLFKSAICSHETINTTLCISHVILLQHEKNPSTAPRFKPTTVSTFASRKTTMLHQCRSGINYKASDLSSYASSNPHGKMLLFSSSC